MAVLIDNLFTMRERNKEEWVKYEQTIRCTKLLVLDDLGAENTDQGWIRCKIDSIVTERYNKMLPTIVTTNLSAEDLLGTYSGRVYDRLRSTSDVITFTGESLREGGGEMRNQVKKKAKNSLCRMCQSDCKDMYKYGKRHVKEGCYYVKSEDSKDE